MERGGCGVEFGGKCLFISKMQSRFDDRITRAKALRGNWKVGKFDGGMLRFGFTRVCVKFARWSFSNFS